MGIEALLLSQVITITGSTGQVVTKQADGSLALQDAAGGGIGGSTGATDNAILRADGAGGATLQASVVTLSEAGSLALPALAEIGLKSNSSFLGGGSTSQYVLALRLASPNDTVIMASLAETGDMKVQSLQANVGPVTAPTFQGFVIAGGWGVFVAAGNYGNRTYVSSVYNVELVHANTYTARVRNANGNLGDLELGKVTATAQSAATCPVTFKGAASQTANLTEWQNSAGTVLAWLSSSFKFFSQEVEAATEVRLSGGPGGCVLRPKRLDFGEAGNSVSIVNSGGIPGSRSLYFTVASDTSLASVGARYRLNEGLSVNATNVFGFFDGGGEGAAIDVAIRRNSAGVVEVNNGTAGTFRDLIVRNLRMSAPTLIPASASATGSAGQISWDDDYIYICTATNTWKRVAIATW